VGVRAEGGSEGSPEEGRGLNEGSESDEETGPAMKKPYFKKLV